LKISLNNDNNSLPEVIIPPNKFNLHSPLNELHDKWLVNLSGKTIPLEVQLLLQLGDRFDLPLLKKDNKKMIVEFIKCIEKNLFGELETISSQVRNQTIPIIKRLLKINNHQTDKLVLGWLNNTKKFVKENPDILFTKADKGNATVALDVLDYKNKMTNIFSDVNTYTFVKKDPTKKLNNNVRNILIGWFKKEYRDLWTYKKLLITDGILPRAYGLPKLHKEGFPPRIIIS